MNKFREQKALSKKIARALGRGQVGDASRLEKNLAPKLTLDHLVKERYPTFIDALRDLDDALSLLFLFANLPSTATVPPKTIARCQRLCHEFQHYLIATNSLRKSFLSIKGIYYQATIQGQDILWLVPYRFVQQVAGDIDFRIMGTFVEFYTTLLGFVNFRLYTSIGLVYPPKFDVRSDEQGAELAAFTLEGKKIDDGENTAVEAVENKETESVSNEVQEKVNTILKNVKIDSTSEAPVVETSIEREDAIDTFEPAAPDADTLPQPQISGNEAAALFAPLTIFISREAPRAPLEFLLRAFGCKRVGWDSVLGDGAFTHDELDPRITHQIVDRPPLAESALPPLPQNPQESEISAPRVRPGHRIPGRIYVQPQWVWDCVNDGKLLRPDLYAPGAILPPHLSPWVKPSNGEYDPRVSLADQEAEGEAERAAEEEDESEEEEEEEEEDEVTAEIDEEEDAIDGEEESDKESLNGGMDIANSDDDEDDSDVDADESFGGFDEEPELDEESEDEADAAQKQHQKELEAEALGLQPVHEPESSKKSKKGQGAKSKKYAAEKKKAEEELERQKMMLSRKKRKLLDKMLYSNKKKEEEAEKLRRKRRKIEQGLMK